MTTTYLGPLVGGRINQYANSAGQVYYTTILLQGRQVMQSRTGSKMAQGYVIPVS
jgi:hypothetical protein